jgi:hypothetical protein
MAAMAACGGADSQGPEEPARTNAIFDLKPGDGAHWDPMPGVADVMISSGLSGEISTITVGALMDLGYPIRWRGAGPY